MENHSNKIRSNEIGIRWELPVVTFTLMSILATNYIQKRRGQALFFSFEYNLLPNSISNKSDYIDRASVSLVKVNLRRLRELIFQKIWPIIKLKINVWEFLWIVQCIVTGLHCKAMCFFLKLWGKRNICFINWFRRNKRWPLSYFVFI